MANPALKCWATVSRPLRTSKGGQAPASLTCDFTGLEQYFGDWFCASFRLQPH